MKPKQMILGIAIALSIVLVASSVTLIATSPQLDLGSSNNNSTPTPYPTYSPTYYPTPTPTREPPTTPTPTQNPTYLYLATDSMVSPREDITGTVTSDIPNIDVVVYYTTQPSQVLKNTNTPTIQTVSQTTPCYTGGTSGSFYVHIEANGSGSFPDVDGNGSAGIQLPQGTYYFTAYTLDGSVQSNTCTVQVIIIY